MNKELQKFVADIELDQRRQDTEILLKIMAEASGYEPYVSGSIIGFGRYHYQYQSGREGESLVTGFSPRKKNMAIYIMPGFSAYEALLGKLGKHKRGKSCLTINRLTDINLDVLSALIKQSVLDMQKTHPCRDS